MAKSRRVVVTIWALTHFKELARLVRFLQRDTHWQPFVLLGSASAATTEAKAEWDSMGVPWSVFGSVLPSSHAVPELAAGSLGSVTILSQPNGREWVGNLLIGFILVVGVLGLTLINALVFVPILISQFLFPRQVGPRLAPLRQQLAGRVPNYLQGLAASFFYPGWALASRALRLCPAASPLEQTRWIMSRLYLKMRVGMLPAVVLLRRCLSMLRLLKMILTLKRTLKIARRYFAQVQPAILVLAEDNVSYPTALLIKAARDNGAASVVIPYTLASTREFVEGFRDDPECAPRGLLNRLAAWYYPRWCHEESSEESGVRNQESILTPHSVKKRILRLPGAHLLALEWLGVAPERPWIPNDGRWDAFAVESPRMLRRYQEEFGLDAERLTLTGAMSDDALFAVKQMAAGLKEIVCRELNLPTGRPLVLLAFPPNQFSAARPGVEFADYADMTRFLIESLGTLADCNVVVSLHPRTSPAARALIESLGGKVSSRDTLELVPVCDVYVASVSATIRWAITCGVPVINYDLFHYCYDDYDSAAGVLSIQTKAEWLETLAELRRRPAWAADWAGRQNACAADWGLLDGRSGRRMVELFDRLAQRSQVASLPASRSQAAA